MPREKPTTLRATILAAQEGDRDALKNLLARHIAPLQAFVRVRAGSVVVARESVSDVVQSVCREALADLADFDYRTDAEFRSWLFLLATRKILDRKKFLRRERRDIGRERAAPEDPEAEELLSAYASVASPSRIASAREELARFEDAVGDLPDNQRDAVAYSKLLGLTYQDVAARMEITESAARGLVARGLANLAHRLRRGD